MRKYYSDHNPFLSFPIEIISYAAGVFDGEGCVSIRWREDKNCPKYELTVANTVPNLVQWFVKKFGGYVSVSQTPDRKRAMYTWALGGYGATNLAEAILPYTIVKKLQLEMALYLRSARLSKDEQKLIIECISNEKHRVLPTVASFSSNLKVL